MRFLSRSSISHKEHQMMNRMQSHESFMYFFIFNSAVQTLVRTSVVLCGNCWNERMSIVISIQNVHIAGSSQHLWENAQRTQKKIMKTNFSWKLDELNFSNLSSSEKEKKKRDLWENEKFEKSE